MRFEQFVRFNRRIDRHRHSAADWYDLHRRACSLAHRFGAKGIGTVLTSVFRRATDPKFLHLAWERLAARSGDTPGRDGYRAGDFGNKQQVFEELRSLQGSLRDGRYQHGPPLRRLIPKADGTGMRVIEVPDFVDRVVQASLSMALQPLIDPLFDEGSYGFRPGRGPLHALAALEELAGGYGVVLSEDVRDAFPSVPHGRLFEVLGHHLHHETALLWLIRAIVRAGGRRRGLSQGGPLSPLLMNLYLHHFLDRRWPKVFPDAPFLIRYVDNVAVACRSQAHASAARAAMAARLQGAGLRLKPSVDSAPDLFAGGTVDWMGFVVSHRGDEIVMRLSDRRWSQLWDRLSAASEGSPGTRDERLRGRVVGWLGSIGPAYRYENHAALHARLGSAFAASGLDVNVNSREVERVWRSAYYAWQRVRRRYGT